MRYRRLSMLILFPILLNGCLFAQEEKPVGVEYNGVGLRQHDARTTQLNGNIKFKAHAGGEIVVEARAAFPCAFGHCPIIGAPPLASERYSTPGAYALLLSEPAKNVMIIAISDPNSNRVRIAHRLVNREEQVVNGVDLSLDRPHLPLR